MQVMTPAYLVLGAESSGTRLVTRLLIQGGCMGSDEHEQAFDSFVPPSNGKPIVWRKSLPHADEMPSIDNIIITLRALRYGVIAVVVMRDMYPTMRSQFKNNHARNAHEAHDNVQRAYGHIFTALRRQDVTYMILTPAGLYAHQDKMLPWLYGILNLTTPEAMETIADPDAKHWEDRQ